MNFTLSKNTKIFLIRSFFFVMALSSLYGIYDNQAFLTKFPFYYLAILDSLFASFFLYITYFLPSILKQRKALILYSIVASLIFTISMNITGSFWYTSNLGLERAAKIAEQSVFLYVSTEMVTLILLPIIVFGFFVWLLKDV